MATERPGDSAPAPPRRTILAPLPDDSALPPAARTGSGSGRTPTLPAPDPADPTQGSPERTERRRRGAGKRQEKPDSSTKAYLWRHNVRFLDTLVMDMEDNGARAGDINRSVVLRAAITALEKAGLARDLARCTNEEELSRLIVTRLGNGVMPKLRTSG